MSKAQFPNEARKSGEFKRQSSAFRHWISADGSTGFRAEPGRYHLYVSSACPWAHRAIIVRRLKKLEDVIAMTTVDPIRDEAGWRFSEQADPIHGFQYLQQAYLLSEPNFQGRVTVPVLWDIKSDQIVNNESSEIIRMLNFEFNQWGDASLDLYPANLRPEIDRLNEWIYDRINNGVYRAGFATTQQAYEGAVIPLFDALDELETRLTHQPYLTGDSITEADWRLFTTLVRFDAVYHGHFKCNLRRILDYPKLSAYVHDLYHHAGIKETVDFDHIKRHYYQTHRAINPTGIVPVGPDLAQGF